MPLLEVRGLTKRFGGLAAVSGVTFDVAAGELVGLIGPNGAGKTTLFHLITGFHRPTAGSVTFDGREVTGLRPHAICRLGLARTFQLVQPFAGLTTLENVMVGAFNRARDVAAARRQAAEIVDFVGLGPRRDVAARNLTLADRKRLEVARGLATGPLLLLLDEVTSALDPVTEAEICNRIRELSGDLTILAVTHQRAWIDAADIVYRVGQGRVERIDHQPKVVSA